MTTITQDGFEYNWKILSIDIIEGTMIVEYDPVQEDLPTITLNVMFNERQEWRHENVDGVLTPVQVQGFTFEDHLEWSVRSGAPIGAWKRQRTLLDNIDAVMAKM